MGYNWSYFVNSHKNCIVMIKIFFIALLTFVSLLNPIQKIFVIFSLQETYSKEALRQIVDRSTRTAFIVLIIFLTLGNEILGYVFNIEIYSFQIICGIVLAMNGLLALQKGAFVNVSNNPSIEAITTVPIAVPMIAGPATITAVVTMPSLYGVWISIAAVTIGILFNWIIMRNSKVIGKFMNKYNLLNPTSRIFGLIVAAIGVQMILNGIKSYIATIGL